MVAPHLNLLLVCQFVRETRTYDKRNCKIALESRTTELEVKGNGDMIFDLRGARASSSSLWVWNGGWYFLVEFFLDHEIGLGNGWTGSWHRNCDS